MDLLPPIAAGDLASTSMAEVLAAAFCARATGTIAVTEPAQETRLFVRYGVPVGVEEPGGLRTFGRHLVAQGLVDEETHERVVALAASQNRRYGELVVAEGRLTADDLRQQLHEHHQASLLRLCLAREGRYELRGWERPPEWTEGLQLDPLRAVVDALQTDELFERRTAIFSLLADRPLRRTIDADELLRMLKPGPLERRVVVTLNVPRLASELGSGLLAPEAAEAFACALALLAVLEPATSEPAPASAATSSASFLRPSTEELEAFPRPVARPLARPTLQATPARPTPIPAITARESAALDAVISGPYARDPELRPSTGPTPIDRRQPTGPLPGERRPPTGPVQVERRQQTGPFPTDLRPQTGPVRVEDSGARLTNDERFAGHELEFDSGSEDEPLELDLRRAPKELVREPPRPPPPPRPPRSLGDSRPGTTSPGAVVVMGSGTEPGRVVRAPAPAPKKPAAPEYNPFAFQLQRAKEKTAPPVVEPPPAAPVRPLEELDLDTRLELAMSEISGKPAVPRSNPPPARAPARPAPPPAAASHPDDDILAGIADAVGDLPDEGTTPITIDEPPPVEGTPPPNRDLDLGLMAAQEEAREVSDRIEREGPAAAIEEIVSDPALDGMGSADEDGIDITFETTTPPTIAAGPAGAGVVLFDEVRDVAPARPPREPTPEPQTTPAPPAGEHASRDDIRRRMLQRALRNVGAPFIPRENTGPQSESPEVPTGTKAEKLDAELDREVKARLAKPANDHFGRLDLPHEASTEQVKEAFLLLAKRFHPDRIVAMGQLELLPQVRELFGQIKESYDVLVDPATRARHLTELDAKDKTKRTADDAKTSFQKAQILLRRKDMKNAEAELVLAVDADPRSEYLAELAWTLFSNPNRRDEAHGQIRELVAKALKATPLSDRAFVVAASVARADGEHEKAEKLFRKALELNPKNVDAGREVRLVEMRRAGEKKPGLLDKLRGK